MYALKQKQNILSKHSVFSHLSARDLSEVADIVTVENFEANETIFAAGAAALCMYIVASGEISVHKTDDYAKSIEIAKLVEGDSLGEIDMISGNARTVTAIAATELSLIRFPPKELLFRTWLEQSPGAGSHLLFSFIADIADRTRKANSLLKENSPQIQDLRRQIYEDKLTGLHNRVYLEEQLPQILAAANGSETSLLMIKPDNFKQVNDVAGHESGDTLLIHLAHLFPSILPKGVLLIRYAGNEFGLVLKETGRQRALDMANKIREFYNTLDLSGFLPVSGIHLTVSTGISVCPEHATQALILIEKAHSLPLVGRAQGGNKILFPEDIAEGTL